MKMVNSTLSTILIKVVNTAGIPKWNHAVVHSSFSAVRYPIPDTRYAIRDTSYEKEDCYQSLINDQWPTQEEPKTLDWLQILTVKNPNTS